VDDLVAEGSQARIFAYGDAKVLKLFRRAGRAAVAEEARKTELARCLGYPAPRVYDVVEIDGSFGFVMERLTGCPLMHSMVGDPSRAAERARTLAELHGTLARLPGAALPPLEPRVAGMIDDAPLPSATRYDARRCLDTCPRGDAIHHGDFHPLNVLSTERGLYVIDWFNACRAHPSADVALTYLIATTTLLADLLPAEIVARIEPLRSMVDAAYLDRYLEVTGVTRDQVRSWMRPLAAARLTDLDRAGASGFDRNRLTAIATGEHPGLHA
jgi:aminoglycoside phosphotransferase (APT) family kinase protein